MRTNEGAFPRYLLFMNRSRYFRAVLTGIGLAFLCYSGLNSDRRFFLEPGRIIPPAISNDLGIKHALYINLERRSDRRTSIETELRAAQISFSRVSASDGSSGGSLITNCPHGLRKCSGMLGCKLSHLNALEKAIQENWEHVAVFEDDFVWISGVKKEYVQKIIRTLQQKLERWDVIAISLNILESEVVIPQVYFLGSQDTHQIVRVRDAKATHGYLVNKHYMSTVKTSFQNCNTPNISIDNCWRALQKDGFWFGLVPQLGTQQAGFSDIEIRNTSYDFIN